MAAVSAVLATIFATEHPKLIVSDNGKEFLLEEFLAPYNMKQLYQPSHVPQPNIENVNGQVRKLLSVEFTKQNNLVWINRLEFIENNLNYYNLQVKKPKVFRNVQLKQNLRVDDSVRISFSVFDSAFRKNIKSGDQKYNNIKYTPRVYTIHKVYKPKTANGLSSYAVEDDDDAVLYNDDGCILKIKQNDLQKIPDNIDYNDMGEVNIDRLNKHKGPGHAI